MQTSHIRTYISVLRRWVSMEHASIHEKPICSGGGSDSLKRSENMALMQTPVHAAYEANYDVLQIAKQLHTDGSCT